MSQGLLYVATCSQKPGLVKVGKTTKETWERERSFAGAVCLEKWKCVAVFETPDCGYSEALAHARLDVLECRVEPRRELFRLDLGEAMAICARAAAVTLDPLPPLTPTPRKVAATVSHANPLWQELLKVRLVGQSNLATLIHDSVLGNKAACGKLRKLGLECVRFDAQTPTFLLDTAVESRLSQWLRVRGFFLDNLLEKKGKNTVKFELRTA